MVGAAFSFSYCHRMSAIMLLRWDDMVDYSTEYIDFLWHHFFPDITSDHSQDFVGHGPISVGHGWTTVICRSVAPVCAWYAQTNSPMLYSFFTSKDKLDTTTSPQGVMIATSFKAMFPSVSTTSPPDIWLRSTTSPWPPNPPLESCSASSAVRSLSFISKDVCRRQCPFWTSSKISNISETRAVYPLSSMILRKKGIKFQEFRRLSSQPFKDTLS